MSFLKHSRTTRCKRRFCIDKRTPSSAFCAKHTCPACGSEKASSKHGCPFCAHRLKGTGLHVSTRPEDSEPRPVNPRPLSSPGAAFGTLCTKLAGVVEGSGTGSTPDSPPNDERLVRIEVYAGSVVHQTRWVFADGRALCYGRKGGDAQPPCHLHGGEYIVAVDVRNGERSCEAIRFTTNRGRQSPFYGGRGGSPKSFQAPPGRQIRGLVVTSRRPPRVIGVGLRDVPAGQAPRPPHSPPLRRLNTPPYDDEGFSTDPVVREPSSPVSGASDTEDLGALAERLLRLREDLPAAAEGGQRGSRQDLSGLGDETQTAALSRVTSGLDCCICLEPFEDETVAPCGHSFCKRCIAAVLRRRAPFDVAPCPMCRRDVRLSALLEVQRR